MLDTPAGCLRQMADILDRIEAEEKANGVTELSMHLKMNYCQTAEHYLKLMRKL